MKPPILLFQLRLLLASCVVFTLPFAHSQWGETPSGDGQVAFGFLVIFGLIGFAAAALFLGLGSLGQFLLRKKAPRFTIFSDLTLFLLFAAVLIFGGVTAKYNDTPPQNATASDRLQQ